MSLYYTKSVTEGFDGSIASYVSLCHVAAGDEIGGCTVGLARLVVITYAVCWPYLLPNELFQRPRPQTIRFVPKLSAFPSSTACDGHGLGVVVRPRPAVLLPWLPRVKLSSSQPIAPLSDTGGSLAHSVRTEIQCAKNRGKSYIFAALRKSSRW